MNGIEVEAAMFKHEFARMCPDMDEGMAVADHRGRKIGEVKEMGFRDFLLNRRLQRDLYVPLDAIEKVAKEIQLKIDEDEIEKMGWRKSA
jgi:hypothetical protein